ncbi:hypothetical protein JOH51_007293 [Rhizobium leguminosarum]|nr:hypothetical protein [Rhizobium leguminosarum]
MKRQDSGLDNLAAMGQAVEKCRRHLGIAEHRRPFTERQVRGDNYRRALVEPADQMEQELAAGQGERQVSEFVEDDEVETIEIVGRPPGGMTSLARDPLYRGHRFPAEVIAHAVWLYLRFPLSLRRVEDMLAARGVSVSHQIVWLWAERFGRHFANDRHRQGAKTLDRYNTDITCHHGSDAGRRAG